MEKRAKRLHNEDSILLNIDEIFKLDFDYVVDCCDTVDTKILLIKYALKCGKKIISSMM